MLLKSLIEETHNNIQNLKTMLKGVKTPEELASVLLALSNQNEEVVSEGSLSKAVLTWSLPVLLTMFSPDFVNSAVDIAKHKSSIKANTRQSEKQQVDHWLRVYSKKYKIDYNMMRRLFEKENKFISKTDKTYDANVVGDVGNTLGPSYGPGQIKVPTAKELYDRYPESDVSSSDITPDRLKNDVKLNARTSCKLMAIYIYHDFKNVKSKKTRYALAATAYNKGITITKKTKQTNTYGQFVAMNTK